MRQTLTFWVLQVLIPELNITVGYRSISGHRHHMTAHINFYEVATDPTSRRLILSTWLEFWPVTWSSIFVHSSISRVSTKQGEVMARRPIRARAVSSCTKCMCLSVIIMFPYQGGFPVHVHVGPCVFPSLVLSHVFYFLLCTHTNKCSCIQGPTSDLNFLGPVAREAYSSLTMISVLWKPYNMMVFLPLASLVTRTHSSHMHASERVRWTPASCLVQPIPGIWGALILNWLVVSNYTRGDDCHHYVTKPPHLPFNIKFQLLQNTFKCIGRIHCRLLTAPNHGRENQFWHITFEITLRVMTL